MFVVFWTERAPDTDHYVIHETETDAKEHTLHLAARGGVLCWGYAPILKSSEAHWPLEGLKVA